MMYRLFLLGACCIGLLAPVYADKLQIIPESQDKNIGATVDAVAEPGHVWEKYNEKAATLQKNKDLGAQMASGIFTWDTLLDYLVYLVRFLSEAGIFVGACFILFAGYKYATNIFGGKTEEGNTAITNAVIGVVVITFSYAIMRAITSAFLT